MAGIDAHPNSADIDRLRDIMPDAWDELRNSELNFAARLLIAASQFRNARRPAREREAQGDEDPFTFDIRQALETYVVPVADKPGDNADEISEAHRMQQRLDAQALPRDYTAEARIPSALMQAVQSEHTLGLFANAIWWARQDVATITPAKLAQHLGQAFLEHYDDREKGLGEDPL